MRPTSVLNHNICWRKIKIAVTIQETVAIPAKTKTQSGIIRTRLKWFPENTTPED